MIRIKQILITGLLSLGILTGCETPEDFLPYSPIIDQFSFDDLNDVKYQFEEDIGTFSHLQGLNITDADYVYEENILTIKKDFLVSLLPGQYDLFMLTNNGRAKLSFTVLDENNIHKIINGGFETGDLFGWTVSTNFKGLLNLQTFDDNNVVQNEDIPTVPIPYQGDGNYVYGVGDNEITSLFLEKMGIMRSSSFVLGGSGCITFKMGAGSNGDLNYMSVRRFADNYEIARYENSRFNISSLWTSSTYCAENLVVYQADLSDYINETLYLEIVDLGVREYNFLTLDSINTFNSVIPVEGYQAIDIKPSLPNTNINNQIPNGDFSDGLNDWHISYRNGWRKSSGSYNTFIVQNEILRSDASGDEARGLIRSSLFNLQGSGIISMQLGAGQGARYDKDTFISIRQALTNQEIFRFANTRSLGVEMVTYYINLSDYVGDTLYIEIVDNGMSDWDVLFVDNIITYYPEMPIYDFSNAAINLNY
jgi:fructan beta-fructosidase